MSPLRWKQSTHCITIIGTEKSLKDEPHKSLYARWRNDRAHLIPILSHPMAQNAYVSDTYHLRALLKRLESDYQP